MKDVGGSKAKCKEGRVRVETALCAVFDFFAPNQEWGGNKRESKVT